MSHAAPPPPSPPPPYICGNCRNPGPGAGACATCGADSWLVATYPPPSPPPAPAYGMPPAQWGGQQGYRTTRAATFGEAVNDALKARYATFAGRSSRSQYWWFQLFYALVAFIGVIAVVVAYGIGDAVGAIALIVLFVLFVLIIIPGICVLVRRLHDTNRSGWWYWISVIPFGGIVLLVFTVLDGTPGSNSYGERPGPYVS